MNFKIQYHDLLCRFLRIGRGNLLPNDLGFRKILFLLGLVLTLSSGAVYAQNVSLEIKNKKLEEVFAELKKQTGVQIIFNHELVSKAKSTSIRLNKVPLKEALTRILADQPLTFEIDNNMILIVPKKNPTNKTNTKNLLIRSKVLNNQNKPLEGVTVLEKNKSNSTITNKEGLFEISVNDPSSIILLRFMGYKNKEILASEVASSLVLEDDSASLEEIVVVGYGQQKRATLTSSISTVNRKVIQETPGASLQNLLTGKVTGLFTQQRSGRPGADGATMNIRGVATFNGGTSPLILVDDIEYNEGQFSMIDVNEIETVSILKDAEATAIYGVKGANGVILVTTRRGATGKPSINLRTQIGVHIPVKPMQTLNSFDAVNLYNEALVNDGLNPMYSEEEVEKFRTGSDPFNYPDVDWYGTVFKKFSHNQDANMDISGGSDRVKYFMSMGFLNQNGLLNDIEYKGKEPEPNTSYVDNNYYFKRYKFRSNLDFKANENLSLRLDLTGTYAETNQPSPNVTFQLFQFDYVRPFGYPVYNPDGSFGYANPNLYEPRDKFNNVAALMSLGGYNRDYNNFMNAMFSANHKLDMITPGLSVKAMATYSYANTASRSMTRTGIPSYFYDGKTETYIPRDINLFRVAPYGLGYSGGTPNNRMNIQAHINYTNSFANAHNVSALLLYNQTSYVSGSSIPFNFLGYTYRFGYNFKERYVFSASGAYNGSDRFISQKRFTLFPAFAVAWNLEKEEFFKLPSFINNLKIAGSYGLVGNDQIGGGNIYFYEETYNRSGSYAFGETPTAISGIVEGSQGNNDVSWETEKKSNVRLESRMFNQKLNIKLDYFYNHRYDILMRRQTVPLSFGVQPNTLPFVNLGEVSNKGWEVELEFRDQIGQLGYHVKGQYSYSKNKLIFRDDPPAKYSWQDRTGLPLNIERQYIWEGGFYSQADLDNPDIAKPAGNVRPGYLKYKDLNNDGLINIDDMAYTGRPNLPHTVLSMNLGFNYKSFSISALFQSNLGANAHLGFDMAVPFKAALQPIHQGRWTPETAESATFPALTTNFVGTYMNPNGNLSSFWSANADYVRLRSMEIGYALSAKTVEKLGLRSVRIFANGYNLATWSSFFKRYQYDPEVASNQNSYPYPVTRIVNLGLNINL